MDNMKAEIREKLAEVLQSKMEEFHLLGYDAVTVEEIWECVTSKYKEADWTQQFQIVNDIFSLKPTQFMNWLTMQAYKGKLT